MPPFKTPNGFFKHLGFMGYFVFGHQVEGNAACPVLVVMTLETVTFYGFPFIGRNCRYKGYTCRKANRENDCSGTLFIMLYKTALGLIFFDFMGQLPKNYGIFPQSGNSEADQ